MRRFPTSTVPVCALFLAAACGGRGEAPLAAVAVPDTCRVSLPPRTGPAPAGAVVRTSMPPPPPSLLVVAAELPLAAIRAPLEAKVPQRLAEERNHDLGMAGRLEYTVDRGPLALTGQGEALVVEAPVRAHAQACARGSCYAGCDPEARVTARIPLRLGADYKMRPSAVQIEVTRGCEVRALGGLVRVDLTPILRARLAQEAKRVEAALDRELPDLRPEAQRLWAELGRPRPLPLGACVVLLPEAAVQGAPAAIGEVARLAFGLRARPEVRVRCGEPPPAPALPPLTEQAALPPEGDVHLAMVLAEEAAALSLEAAPDALDLGATHARVRRAVGGIDGLTLTLAGEACGEVAVRAGGVGWTAQSDALHLTDVAPVGMEGGRLSAVGVDPVRLGAALERAPLALPISIDALRAAVPELARAASDERLTVAAAVSEAKAETAGLRGSQPVALVRLRGTITIRGR